MKLRKKLYAYAHAHQPAYKHVVSEGVHLLLAKEILKERKHALAGEAELGEMANTMRAAPGLPSTFSRCCLSAVTRCNERKQLHFFVRDLISAEISGN